MSSGLGISSPGSASSSGHGLKSFYILPRQDFDVRAAAQDSIRVVIDNPSPDLRNVLFCGVKAYSTHPDIQWRNKGGEDDEDVAILQAKQPERLTRVEREYLHTEIRRLQS